MKNIVVIAHDLRSTHNVGSLLRTCEGLGIDHVYLTGYTPYPESADDARLPHERAKLMKAIKKTALGAESLQSWSHETDVLRLISSLQAEDFTVFALEQSPAAIQLPAVHAPQKVALLLGREVEGIDRQLLAKVDQIIEIPMYGKKESFNVVEATTMALYHLRFVSS